ncbi:MAG TPA: PHP domain-containing protein [Acidimicrobiales bacterium]|nr:PHP domain-containing protein [Acidimicrobiales bacterium]
MEPVEALEAIAYTLETKGAPGFKIKAFRSAAETIRPLGRDELARLAEGRGLGRLPGVGETTATVIREALAGGTPQYLTDLGGSAMPSDEALSPEAEALHRALRGDCHTHSEWSDGSSPVTVMAHAAAALGHDYVALTDHSPRLTVAHGLNRERLAEQLALVAELNEELAPFRILTGIEVDILEDGGLDQEPELLATLDVVVASVHSKLRMDAKQMTRRMVAAMESPYTDILGHCTGRLLSGKGRPQSEFDAEEVFSCCAEHGKAVEINSRPERRDPPPALLERALGLGCLVTIDTDAHAPGQLEWQPLGCIQAAAAGVRPDQIVNTHALDEILAWTASHRAS